MNFKNQETQNEDFKIDENIAYFIGVLHSDGCIYVFNDKKRNRKQIRLSLMVGCKSIPMAIKFQKILLEYFGKTVNLRKIPNKNAYSIQTSINRVWHIFQHWDNYNLPDNIKNSKKLFGAYLAGIIDGDGTVKIKHNKDRVIPQYVVKIASDCPLQEIKFLIGRYLTCSVYFEYDHNKKGNGVNTCFYLSKKNVDSVKHIVYPHIELLHKKERLEKYFRLVNEPARIRTGV